MKRLVIASLFIILVGSLAFWGDRLVASALDAKLAPLLERELGLPVTLAPIKASVLTLTARSPKLVMGDTKDPAVVATDVEVRVSLRSLLEAEVRLIGASASDLMVRPARWPSSGEPLPDNYQFLDQWLPSDLSLEQGQYVTESGSKYPVQQLRWHRQLAGGATLDWQEQRFGGQIEVSGKLSYLHDLLQLSPISLELLAKAQGKEQSEISVSADIEPDGNAGYNVTAKVSAAGISADIVAGNRQSWKLPDHSDTKIPILVQDRLKTLLNVYTSQDSQAKSKTLIETPLPALSFIDHTGSLSIKELRLGDEAVRDSTLKFKSSERGFEVSSLSVQGPGGLLSGQFGIVSDEAGWTLNLKADVTARLEGKSIAGQYLDADWIWHEGDATLQASGDTWGALLASLAGDVSLEGQHLGSKPTPVKINAHLDNRAGELSLDQMNIAIGEGSISGSMALSSTKPRLLTADINARQLDFDFLFETEEKRLAPGIAIPDYLEIFPDLLLRLKAKVRGLHFPGISVSSADFSLRRQQKSGRLEAMITGLNGGSLDLLLDAYDSPRNGATNISLKMKLDELDIPQMFEQDTLFNNRSSGTIDFRGQGNDMDEIFKSMHGQAKLALDVRSDNDWSRKSLEQEQLRFSGDATLAITGERILGVEISDIDIESTQQEVTGKVSVVADRTPWIIAELESRKLDIPGLRGLLPETTEEADERDVLKSLKAMGSMRLSLAAKNLLVRTTPLSDVKLDFSSASDRVSIEQMDFTLEDSPIKLKGEITWQGESATLSATAAANNLDIDRFLVEYSNAPVVPVSGSASFQSKGSKFSELLANLTGDIDLKSIELSNKSLQARRQLSMTVRRVPDGMKADINTLHWGESDLEGSVHYRDTSPPLLEVAVTSGTFSLLPWEQTEAEAKAEKTKARKEKTSRSSGDILGGVAQESSRIVGRLFSAPSRIMGGPGESSPGEKYFSSNPLPFSSLDTIQASITGRIDALTGTEHIVHDLTIDGKLRNGKLAVELNAGKLNGGKSNVKLDINSRATPPTVNVAAHFEKVGGKPGSPGYPKSGAAFLQSRGNSPAQLAANLSGEVLIEVGAGPFNFESLTLINADVASEAIRTLIPGLERTEPTLECGMSMAEFKDGMGVTPYGYAARTNQANLIGRIELDLRKELLQLRFDSRSRQGVGLSVGSVFANTVQIKGPLTDPRIVPQTASIVVRGWAAFMTVGLSVVGESVLKRALASENPCKAIKKDIQKDVCSTNRPLASSPLICPG